MWNCSKNDKRKAIKERKTLKRIGTNKSHSRLTDDDDRKKIWLNLPYNGKLGEKLVTSLIKNV